MRKVDLKQLKAPEVILDQVLVDLIRKYSKRVRKQQIEQEKELREKLKPTASLTYIVRDQDKPDEQPIEDMLKLGTQKPRIIILKNDIIYTQDVMHFIPNYRKYFMSFLSALGDMVDITKDYESGLNILLEFRKKFGHILNDYIGKSTIAGFMANTVNQIQDNIFGGQDCEVIIVRNSTSEDLIKSVELGGNKSAVVVSGHGSISSVVMSDKVVSNDTLPTPKEPLKAFIQHTCGGKGHGVEMMGERIAEEVYGINYIATDSEHIRKPLNKRDLTKYKYTKGPSGKIYIEAEK